MKRLLIIPLLACLVCLAGCDTKAENIHIPKLAAPMLGPVERGDVIKLLQAAGDSNLASRVTRSQYEITARGWFEREFYGGNQSAVLRLFDPGSDAPPIGEAWREPDGSVSGFVVTLAPGAWATKARLVFFNAKDR